MCAINVIAVTNPHAPIIMQMDATAKNIAPVTLSLARHDRNANKMKHTAPTDATMPQKALK